MKVVHTAHRRSVLGLLKIALVAAAAVAASSSAHAQWKPSKPITIIVP